MSSNLLEIARIEIVAAVVGFFCLLLFPAISSGQTCGTPGKDGVGSLNGIVNTYFPGIGTANSSSTSVSIGAATNIESATTPVSPGDLLLIIQIQDASVNTSNSSNYGAGKGTGSGFTSGNAGYYEYAVATNNVSLSGGTVTLASALTRSYYSRSSTSTQGKQSFQVIRVPQYSSATISGTVSAASWDGTTGGIVVFDVTGALTMSSGTVSAAGKGFRGGLGRSLSGGTGGANTDYVSSASNNFHASKGEGIAGTPRYVYNGLIGTDTTTEGYPSGSYARGAPGNAGGGTDGAPASNSENSGGGGGNGGNGGNGGKSWSAALISGGIGGAVFPAAANRLVMGGGGGAGTTNNAAETTASGAPGGGIVMIRAASITGTGTINANGASAPDSNPSCCGDGAGGGGAGGSILITANSGLSGISASATGGKGGSTLSASTPHGPGGGGGGGVIFSNGSLGLTTVTGGTNGTTSGITDTSYGATSGGQGAVTTTLSASSINGTSAGVACIPVLTVTKSTSTSSLTLSETGATAQYKITVTNAANRAAATNVSISDTLPQPVSNGFTYAATSSVTLSGNASRSPANSPTGRAVVPAWDTFTIPGGGSVVIDFTVNIAINVPSGTYQNPAAAIYLDPARTASNGTAVANYNSASSTNEDVKIVSRPNLKLVKSCADSSGADCNTLVNQTYIAKPGDDLTYKITFTNGGGAAAAGLALVDTIPDNTDYKIGSAAAAVGSSGLTFAIEFSSNYSSANPSAAVWTYTPASGGGGASAGYDRNVKAVRWRVISGTVSTASPDNTGNVSFVAKIR